MSEYCCCKNCGHVFDLLLSPNRICTNCGSQDTRQATQKEIGDSEKARQEFEENFRLQEMHETHKQFIEGDFI